MQVDPVGIGEQVEDDFRANGPSFTVDAALCWTAFGFCPKRTRRQDRLATIDRQEVKETALQFGERWCLERLLRSLEEEQSSETGKPQMDACFLFVGYHARNSSVMVLFLKG